MMKSYDNNSGANFSWDGHFHFNGYSGECPEGAVTPDKPLLYEMGGAYFLSGYRSPALVLWTNSKAVCAGMGFLDDKGSLTLGVAKNEDAIARMSGLPVVLCGPACRVPSVVAEMCSWYPSSQFFACPIIDELAAFGVLAAKLKGKDKPKRLHFYKPNEEQMAGESQKFDPKLEGDGYGRMADLVSNGTPVLNEMMTGIGIYPFYGKILDRQVGGAPTFIVSSCEVSHYFPKEPVSAKVYACTSVPVEFRNTEVFANASGCNADKVNIAISSDFVPGVSDFIRFLRVIMRKGIIGVTDPKDMIPQKFVPVFRYNEGYRISVEEYAERFSNAN